MCGIVGGIFDNSDYKIHQILNIIKHRGPDHSGAYQALDLALGHTRLSIIDLTPESNQPLWDSTHSACIVFNGEIYNYMSLRKELVTEGYTFSSHGDAEVIVNLYLHYGIGCFSKLRGIFALALWDARTEELYVVRDTFGVKPLYYSESNGSFYFASEMKALKDTNLPIQLNYDALFRSIIFLWSPGPDTVIDSIKKLEPGTLLRVKKGRILDKSTYSSWPKLEFNNSSVEKHLEEIEASLVAGVREQLVSDVPIGAFLSGGLDSSLIVAIAAQQVKKPLECFTISAGGDTGNSDGFADDLPYAKAAAAHLNVPLNIVDAKPEIIKYLYWMIYHLDEPQADPAPINVALICKAAREKGIKVLFSGAGGDDVFSGYRRHYAINLEKIWSWLPQGVRSVLKVSTQKLPKRNPKLRRISKMFAYADLSSDERLLSYFYWIKPEVVYALFTEEAKKQMSDNPLASLIDEISQLSTKEPLEKMLYLERKYFLVDHNFNYTDKMSMAHGVEVRVPFVDQRVVDYAAKIPSKLKQKGRQSKWILKKVAEKYLPKSIIYRPKTGFGAPLRYWLKNDLKEVVSELLGKESIEKRGIFKYEAVKALIDADRNGLEDYAYPIFSLICIEVWCRIFIDDDKSGDKLAKTEQKESVDAPVSV